MLEIICLHVVMVSRASRSPVMRKARHWSDFRGKLSNFHVVPITEKLMVCNNEMLRSLWYSGGQSSTSGMCTAALPRLPLRALGGASAAEDFATAEKACERHVVGGQAAAPGVEEP